MLIPRTTYYALKLIGNAARCLIRATKRGAKSVMKRIEPPIPIESYEMSDDEWERLMYGSGDPPLDSTRRDSPSDSQS